MGLILHSNSDHYISMVKVGNIWFECDDVKSLKLSVTISITLIMLICYFTKEANDEHILRGIGLVPMDAVC